MAGIAVPAPSVTTAATTSTARAVAAPSRPWLAPAAAAAVGALSGVLATWAVVATQTLQMSL